MAYIQKAKPRADIGGGESLTIFVSFISPDGRFRLAPVASPDQPSRAAAVAAVGRGRLPFRVSSLLSLSLGGIEICLGKDFFTLTSFSYQKTQSAVEMSAIRKK